MNLTKTDHNEHKVTIIQNSKVDYKNLLAKRKYEKLCAKDERKAFLKSVKKNHPLLEELDYYAYDEDDECMFSISTRNLGIILIEDSELKKKKLILEVEDFEGIYYSIPLYEIINITRIPRPKPWSRFLNYTEPKRSWFDRMLFGEHDPRV